MASYNSVLVGNYLLTYLFQGIYVTEVYEDSPASKSGLRMHDKILQVS